MLVDQLVSSILTPMRVLAVVVLQGLVPQVAQ